MPQESQLAHRNVRSANLPYVTNISPTNTEPCFITGSQDVLTSIAGYAERRPGFADYVEGITVPTVFTNLQRLFTWDRFDGTFIRMACDINSSGQAVVYKQVVGTDPQFGVIYTDASSTPFDFVVSNNTVYFSNGNSAKKWDPINGLSNWGISIGSINAATGPNAGGTAADGPAIGTYPWSSPGNILANDGSFATVTLPSNSVSHYLLVKQFGFSIPSTTTPTGIQVDIKGKLSGGVQPIAVSLLKNGTEVGNYLYANLSSVNTLVTVGGSNNLWGSPWTANDISQTGFGIAIYAFTKANAATYSLDYAQITVYGLGGPGTALAAGPGLTASTGYQYVVCYGNSATGHVSGPSPPSASQKPSNQTINVTLVASTDPQVNQIRVFRSTDSVATGQTAQNYFEIPTSPFSNTNQTINDSASDASLSATQIAPYPNYNSPPPAMQGMVYFSGRIWGFTQNQVWFSELDELTIGVPEESFVSGIAGNFWNFDQPVQGLAVVGSLDNQALAIFCGGRIYGITGNSIDTFRRFTISKRRGCRNLECISELGGMVAWLDSANQVWASDGSSLRELSTDIRPDLVNLVPANCALSFHVQGRFHWLVLSTGSKLYVYDIDTEQWMPPWTFSCNYLFSGEIAPGSYRFMAATSTTALQLSTTSHNDNGTKYTPIAYTNNMAMVPDFGTRFSYAALGIYDQPSRTGVPWQFQVDTNNASLGDVLYQVDDDPFNSQTTFTSIFANKQPITALNRNTGTYLVQNLYSMNTPSGRWASFQIKGLTADDNLRIYGWYMNYKELGGR